MWQKEEVVMSENMFNVKVHFIDRDGIEGDLPTVTILAKDDVLARKQGLAVALFENERRSFPENIKKVLYCEIEFSGTLDGRANKASTGRQAGKRSKRTSKSASRQ
jgi:hypothetical protein